MEKAQNRLDHHWSSFQGPVSYTHLDVYKRQELNNIVLKKLLLQ
ncbi:hypothetical protein [Candidatus Enterococcus wittei]|nr:hypothetical protein [Enterococcus sp. 10A9_DIV0425]